MLYCCTSTSSTLAVATLHAKRAGRLRLAAHGLETLSDLLVDLEELCRTPVDADSLALVEVGLGVPVLARVGLDTLGVARVDEAVAAGASEA